MNGLISRGRQNKFIHPQHANSHKYTNSGFQTQDQGKTFEIELWRASPVVCWLALTIRFATFNIKNSTSYDYSGGTENSAVENHSKSSSSAAPQQYNFTIALCMMAKDSEQYLQEWIDYHLAMKSDAIYIMIHQMTNCETGTKTHAIILFTRK